MLEKQVEDRLMKAVKVWKDAAKEQVKTPLFDLVGEVIDDIM